jgi:large subunit ribosomal protein L4e
MVKVYGLDGKPVAEMPLPGVFKAAYRPDLVQRAVLAVLSHRRQPYGTNPLAGLRTAAHFHGKRHIRPGVVMQSREMARLPRVHGSSPAQAFRARLVPQARSGRAPHPPLVKKIWWLKLNDKERRAAIRSAIAASANAEAIKARGHMLPKLELPIIIDDAIQRIKKTSDIKKVLLAMQLGPELKRAKKKKIRPGKGKSRGRKYRRKASLLLVIDKDLGITKAAANVPGVDVITVRDLNALVLAPGAQPGRLVVWSRAAALAVDKLFR